MHKPSHHLPALPPTLVWRGLLAVGLLWLLALGSWELGAAHGVSDTDRRSLAPLVDMPLHANSDHSLSLKRFFPRPKTQPDALDLPDTPWALLPGNLLAVSFPHHGLAHFSLTFTSGVCRHQLQALNVPRAPPLV